jgi:sugar/nucleoside kinase (ribokinase family)
MPREPRRTEQGRPDGLTPVELVLIGHVGIATDQTAKGTETHVGGSGFATAFAASALLDGVGLVAQVGRDFDLSILRQFAIETAGVAVLPGASATFFIDQTRDGSLSFSSDLGVAAEPRFDLFPESYFRAGHVHLGTAPPKQQLAWLEFFRDKGCRAQISVDMFEPFVTAEPGACREICDRADLIFLNETEYRGLYHARTYPSGPTVLKRGPAGAEFRAASVWHRIPAPPDEVDPIVPCAARSRTAGGPGLALLGSSGVPVGYRIRSSRPKCDRRTPVDQGATGIRGQIVTLQPLSGRHVIKRSF